MMPIQRQSDWSDGLNGTNLRWAKEYETRDLPEGLINALSRGVGITAGLNDPRGMAREAVDVSGMDPNSHAYAQEPSFSPYDSQGGGRDWDPNTGYQPSSHDEQQSELVGQDDDSGYNWGPEPQGDTQFREPAPTPTGDVQGFGFGGNRPYDPAEWDHETQGPPPPGHFDDPAEQHLGNVQVDYDNQFSSHTASFGEAHSGGPASAKIAVAPAVQNAVVPGWVGHGYVPGHRIALPLPQGNFQGTVTHLAGPEVGIRWDDGQHSTEEPANLRPL